MEIVASVTSKGQVTIPREVRKRLGIAMPDKISFVLSESGVQVKPAAKSIESVFRSFPSPPGQTTEEVEREVDDAMELAADEIVASHRNP